MKLITVAPFAEPPPSLDTLAALAKEVEVAENDAAAIAAGDQLQATERDSLPSAECLDGARALVARLAVTHAARRRVAAHCPHVRWPEGRALDGGRVIIALAARVAVCRRPTCVTAAELCHADDRRCEVCEQLADGFRVVTVALGAALVIVHAGISCGCARLFER